MRFVWCNDAVSEIWLMGNARANRDILIKCLDLNCTPGVLGQLRTVFLHMLL